MNPAPINQSIQGLRGISIVLVFFSHWYVGLLAAGLLGPSLQSGHIQIFNLGKYGVEVFFMISGYVIVKSLRCHTSLWSFVIARIARIYPLFLLLHIAVFTLGPIFHYKFFVGVDAAEWLYLFIVNLLLLPGVFDLPLAQPVAWSLSYEIAFYALAIMAMVLLRPKSRVSTCGGWVAWSLLAAMLLSFHPRTVFFLPGVAAALWGDQIRSCLARVPAIVAAMSLPVFLAVWAQLGLSSGRTLFNFGLDPLTWSYYAFALLSGALFFSHATLVDSWLSRALGARVMSGLGNVSYSFYLLHLFVIVGLRTVFRLWVIPHTGLEAGFWIFGFVGLNLAILLALFGRWLMEVRVGNWMRLWLQSMCLCTKMI